jgi:AraC family transcriptional regulator
MTRDGVTVNPIARALWFVESHFAQEITLDDVASVAGVSRYHLSRTFSLATGTGLMAYVRARRLSEAARVLAAGAPDILTVALDWGYGSHEAFSRAFREQFALTPEAVRTRGQVTDLPLMEALRMDDSMLTPLDPPRIVDQAALHIAGLNERYDHTASAAIPSQWQRFTPHLGHVPGQMGQTAFGVIHNSDDAGHADYLTGVEVKDFSSLPAEFSRLTIPPQRYAVFTHRDHISSIRRTWLSIWNKGLPEAGLEATGGPEFERYDERFDGGTGNGVVEIWIPVRA